MNTRYYRNGKFPYTGDVFINKPKKNRYGKLLVLKRSRLNTMGNKPRWVVACDCGRKTKMATADLRRGHCGCELSRYYNSQPATKERDLKRFWECVNVQGPDDCWEWKNKTDRDGYGCFGFGIYGWIARTFDLRSPIRAHRLSYVLHKKKDPGHLCVLHKCDNPKCVNPNHLFLGTQQKNIEDKKQKGRSAKGERNGASKLSAAIVREIRALYKFDKYDVTGLVNHIRKKYGIKIGYGGIHLVVQGKTWKHV